jgi:hypothetical protein
MILVGNKLSIKAASESAGEALFGDQSIIIIGIDTVGFCKDQNPLSVFYYCL